MSATDKSLSRFGLLRPGSIKPDGWLLDFALINADAWLLNRANNREHGIYDPLWNRLDDNDVLRGTWGAFEVAYFSDALIRNASILPGSNLAREVDPWIEQALAAQEPDGYLGVYKPPFRWSEEVADMGEDGYEIFSIGHVIEALLYHYERTGDSRCLNACKRSANAVLIAWNRLARKPEASIFGYHSPYVLRALVKMYAVTGDRRYRKTAKELLDRFGRVKAYLKYSDDRLKTETSARPRRTRDSIKWEHNVMEAMQVGLPIILYEYTGDQDSLRASLEAWENMQDHLSVDGSPVGNEAIIWNGPRDGCEHCGVVQWIITGNELARITGEVKYADAVERAFYNGYPAARSIDGMMVAYIHSANQLVASDWSSPHVGSRDGRESKEYFSMSHKPLCCNLNSPRGIPYFVGSMAMAADEGLAVLYYGPCRIETDTQQGGKVGLRMDTDYPFEDEVRISVEPERPAAFSLKLRIPGWCTSADLKVNGEALSEPVEPGEYAVIQREWNHGDEIRLKFNVPVRLIEYPETHSRVGGVAVQRGPLTYALPVSEDWQPYDAVSIRDLKDKIMSYRILPDPDAEWNYALVINGERIEDSFTLTPIRVPPDGRPWEHPPLGLRVKARRVLNWRMDGEEDHPMTPGLPYKPMKLSDKVTTVTLVPFGFTHLRLAYLPTDESYSRKSSEVEPVESPPVRG